MTKHLLAGLIMGGIAIPPTAADVLDDLGVTERQFARGFQFPVFHGTGTKSHSLLGLEISDAHAKGIEVELRSQHGDALISLHEGRGDFAKALDAGNVSPLVKVRLLFRAGRLEEARAALGGEEFGRMADSLNPGYYLLPACRPLEDAEAWDDLQGFLRLLSERLDSPLWRGAFWAEELDVAYHLDRVQALMDGAAGDPLRLAVFHHRLGNTEERDRLVVELMKDATPARVTEMLGMFRTCAPVVNQANYLWNRGNLTPEERVELCEQFLLPRGEGFDEVLRAWLVKGGDATPLADLIWRRWAMSRVDSPSRSAVLAALLQRHPDEPRFQWLVARQLMKSDSARAAALFEKVAAQPVTAAKDTRPAYWMRDDLQNISEETQGDLPYLAIRGLGLLDRQDRVRAVLDGQSGWADLPAVDKVRYLAAGGMDFELIKVTLAADFQKPANDALPRWLKTVLDARMKSRVLPQALVAEIAAKFDALVMGSPEKAGFPIVNDAMELLEVLGNEELETEVWKNCLGRLATTLGNRDRAFSDSLDGRLRSAVTRHPRLKALLPDAAIPRPSENKDEDFSKGMEAFRWLTLFQQPQLRRISPMDPMDRPRFSNFQGPIGGPDSAVPLVLLDRWAENLGQYGMGLRGIGRPMRNEDQAVLQALMRHFGAGSPRRLLVEILIAKDLLDCGDEALKAEARASVAAMMSGENRLPGTEAFRYMSLAHDRVPEDELRKALAEVKKLPPSAREEFILRFQPGGVQHRANLELARRELGIPDPRQDRTPPQPDEDGLKLNALERRNLSASPEAVELARRLLDKAMTGGSDLTGHSHVSVAARVLQTTGTLDAWIKEAREKLSGSGVPEVEVLRRLQRIDQRQSAADEARSLDYAREILALDPTDSRAAGHLASKAAEEGDRKLLLTCVRAMGAEGLSQLSRGEILSTFGKEDAAEVFAVVREQNLQGRMPGNDALRGLHGYFLASDPAVATEFRGWLAARGEIPSVSRFAIAGQLLDAGRRDEAVELLARPYVTPPDYPGFPHQFPPKPGSGLQRPFGSFDVSTLEPDLAFLRDRKLFAEVADRIEGLGNAEPMVIATFRMAATPDTAMVERYALPILDQMGEPYRGATIIRWSELFAKQPGTAPVLLKLLEERAKTADDQELDRLVNTLQSAADLPGGSGLIATHWPRLAKVLAGLDDPVKKERLTRSMCSLLRPMLHSADDATWSDYLTWREGIPLPLGQLDHSPLGHPPTGFIDPARLGRLIPRILTEAGGELPAAQAQGWALAAAATRDPALLEKVKAALPATSRAAAELCDLALGGAMAASPVLGVDSEENGETLLTWNLVAVPPVDRESEIQDIPRCPFPALDGKFEIQITAGSEPDRQVIVWKFPAASAAGHVRLKLAPDHRYVALLATEAATGVVRWTRPMEVGSGGGLPLPVSDADWVKRGFEKLKWNGPGGLPAWKIRFSGRDRIDLLERPWNGTEPITLGAWVSGDGKLQLRCLDAEGRELAALELISWDALLPVWQFRDISAPGTPKIPAETVRLVLSASVHGHNDGPIDFAISNARMEIGPPAALPEKTERITRIPGTAVSLALSPDARRLAVCMTSGKLVMVDLESREVTEIPPLRVPEAKEGRGSWVTWNATGLYSLQADGFLCKFDEQTRTLGQLFQLRRGNDQPGLPQFMVSGDGQWVVWSSNARRLMLASTDGGFRREISSDASNRFTLTDEGIGMFDREGRRILLKTADFRSGEPVAVEGPSANPPEQHPVWKNRLRFKNDSMTTGVDAIKLPVERNAAAIATDGTLYYLDETGNLMRLKP